MLSNKSTIEVQQMSERRPRTATSKGEDRPYDGILFFAIFNRVWYTWLRPTNRNLWRDFLNFPYFTGFSAH